MSAIPSFLPTNLLAGSTPGSAQGDAYAVFGQVFALGQVGPVFAGPISPTQAVVPPGQTASAQQAVLNYNSCVPGIVPGTCSSFQQPVVDFANAAGSTSKATIKPAGEPSTDCTIPGQSPGLPLSFNAGPLSGGNACAFVGQVGALNTASSGTAQDVVETDDVEVQSITQSCTADPQGFTHIAHLAIGGTNIIGGAGATIPVDPAANTIVPVPAASPEILAIVLNEQIPDNHGHGMTVNAIHVWTNTLIGPIANADVIIGHAHSMAVCPTGTLDTAAMKCPSRAVACAVPTGNKTPSTKFADPGDAITYDLAINQNSCPVTTVTDVLPPLFHYTDSGPGDLNVATVSTLGDGQTSLFYHSSGLGFPTSKDPLVERIHATLDPAIPPGQYVNLVYGTSDCGSFAFIDFLAVPSSGGHCVGQPPAPSPCTPGDNPGIIVPRPGAAPSPSPSASASASPSPSASASPSPSPVASPSPSPAASPSPSPSPAASPSPSPVASPSPSPAASPSPSPVASPSPSPLASPSPSVVPTASAEPASPAASPAASASPIRVPTTPESGHPPTTPALERICGLLFVLSIVGGAFAVWPRRRARNS